MMSAVKENEKISECSTLIESVVSKSIVETCRAFGMSVPNKVEYTGDAADRPASLAVIDFHGDGVDGYLAVNCDERFSSVADPANLAAGVSSAEWANEVANTVLGKIKGGLAKHLIPVKMETPIGFDGANPKFSRGKRPPVKVYMINQDGTNLTVLFWAEISERVRFCAEMDEDAVVGEAGDVLLF